MAKGKYFLNDWEALAELRDYSDYLADNDMGFEEAWRKLCETLPEDYEEDYRKGLNKAGHTPFDALYINLAIGRYPPPELMEMLRFVFGNYLSSKGKRDLESLFFGKFYHFCSFLEKKFYHFCEPFLLIFVTWKRFRLFFAKKT